MEKHAIFSTLDPLATIQLIYLGLFERATRKSGFTSNAGGCPEVGGIHMFLRGFVS